MHVLFVEPQFPDNQRQFVRGLHEAGARVTGIGERPGRGARRRAPQLAASATSRSRIGLRRGGDARRRAPRAGARLGRPARGHGRGAHHARRARCARPCGIPGTTVQHRLPLPRQAGDEGGAARGRRPDRAVDAASTRREELRTFAAEVGFPLILKPRARRRRRRAPRASTTTASSRARSSSSGLDRGALGRGRGVHRGPRGLLRHALDRRQGRARVHLALLPERARGDAHALDLAADRRPRTASTPPGYDELKQMGQKVIARARHRHLGDAHGVVLRPQGAQVLRDRLPPAGRRRLGPLRRRQRLRPLPRVGASRSSTARPRSASPRGTPPA